MNDILAYFAVKYNGDWDEIYAAINRKEKVDLEEKEILLSKCDKYITLLDNEYPTRLKGIYKPPFVLFYKGDISLLNTINKTIGVVGNRKNSDYGKESTEKIVKDLVESDCVIVSGLAKGIDVIAHKTCLDNGGKTIAVLGNGVDVSYPLENKDIQEIIANKGLIISEYPDYLESKKEYFPKRNRIVAGLSDAILVTEAKNKSGSMITVARALEMGKDIFCVPHLIGQDSGCNSLIKEGANLIECAKDILIQL